MGKQNVQVKKLTRRVQRANASIVPLARRKNTLDCKNVDTLKA